MNLNKTLMHLEQVNKEDANKVFTMYLNTDPADPDQQGGEWKIHFKNGMRNFEQYLVESENKEELKNFQLVKSKVEKFVKENEQNFLKGIIVFATADEDVWFADRVQMRVEDEFYWQETPVIDQLKRLQTNYPKSGIILVQQNEIKVIDSNLNQVEETVSFELDLDTEDWRTKQGPRKSNSSIRPGATNLQKDNFQSRYEANIQRRYKKIAPKLDKQAKENQWDKIYIIGEADASSELESQMNKSVDNIIQKNMLDHEESKVLQHVFG